MILEHLQQKQVGQQNPWLANRQQSILIPTLNDLPKQNQPPQWHQEWIQQNGQVPIPLDVTAHITGKKVNPYSSYMCFFFSWVVYAICGFT